MQEYDYENAGYQGFLRELVAGGDITHRAAEGITKQVIDQGEESLTPNQRQVFQTQVKSVFIRPICSLCEEPVEWDLAYEQLNSSKPLCSHCRYRLDKLERE